jgi:GT2 family glycosyltransferase
MYGVLGRVTWRPDRPISPFMHWLENGGPQFDFPRLRAGFVSAATHFITAHLSMKRELLLSVGGFDERFRYAAVEDAELGARLRAKDFMLEYHPELVVHHDHPTTLRAATARMQRVGEAARFLRTLHPDGAGTAFSPPRRVSWVYAAAALAARVALHAGARGSLRRRAWELLMLDAYARGYRRAQ